MYLAHNYTLTSFVFRAPTNPDDQTGFDGHGIGAPNLCGPRGVRGPKRKNPPDGPAG
ncbi:hypothetical protein ABI_07950 [Asticcacaulis biprosthecium C19]|uniref:Uncharacterized protein n=1 Tax=Asticcacaulis biprosthecium C19 TaxID=715226 RepID=F4QLT9_9CAUL|nr:hypothetical protein ABI_07950 [Asticcacaulis biprosthecium C19]